MSGNRNPIRLTRPLWTVKNTATHNHTRTFPGASIMRRKGSASRPRRYAVDLRSSIDPDPLPAFACTQPREPRQSGHNRLTAPVDPAPLLQG
jgi:hypothetical protein